MPLPKPVFKSAAGGEMHLDGRWEQQASACGEVAHHSLVALFAGERTEAGDGYLIEVATLLRDDFREAFKET